MLLTARDDRYTTWRSLYLPFSHFLCQIFNLFSGIPTENLFKFRNESKSILFLFFLAYSTQVYLLSRQLRTNFKCLRSALILIVFSTAVPILFAYERGNLLVFGLILYSLFLLSSSNTLKILFAALAASIKPYILLFSLPQLSISNKKITSAVVFVTIFIALQVISYVSITPQGIEFLSANLKYFSQFSSIHDLASYSFLGYSFMAYDTFNDLFYYGNTQLFLERTVPAVLMIFKLLSIIIFSYVLVNFFYLIYQSFSIEGSKNHVVKYEIITLLLTFLFASLSLKSGTYAVSFMVVALASLEGKVRVFNKNSIIFLLFFISLCFFDLPLVDDFSYPCDNANYLSYITGIQFVCGQKLFGIFAIIRPLMMQIFFYTLHRLG